MTPGDKTPPNFEWRGVAFKWRWLRMAFVGYTEIGGGEPNHALLVRETLPGKWESWFEWQGGYTMPCTMGSRELALEGAALELKSFHERSLADLGALLPGAST